MLVYKSGLTVTKGTYWDLASGRRIDALGQVVLPGSKGTSYIRLPAGLMLIVIPFVGLLYIVSMPFFGLRAIVSVMGAGVPNIFYGLVMKNVSFGWRPKRAFLSENKKAKWMDISQP